MKPTRWTAAAFVVSTLVLVGATCEKNGAAKEADSAADAAKKSSASTASTAPDAARPPAGAKPAAAQGSIDIPGFDFSMLTPAAQQELSAVFSDEFCYCGCPHTLGACLKEHGGCKHAKRMALLAAREASEGAPSTEIIVLLSKYYLSFRERVKLEPDPRMCMGSADAKVTIVEFSDFECPYCAAARPLLENFARKTPDVRFCYAPFPLQGHPNALPAAQAALFAREHGKFWEMHDLLFEHQMELSKERIVELAGKLGLSKPDVKQAIDSGQFVDELNAMKDAGKAVGVQSTPSIYVNGRKFLLPLSTETLRHTVEDEREWMANGGGWKD